MFPVYSGMAFLHCLMSSVLSSSFICYVYFCLFVSSRKAGRYFQPLLFHLYQKQKSFCLPTTFSFTKIPDEFPLLALYSHFWTVAMSNQRGQGSEQELSHISKPADQFVLLPDSQKKGRKLFARGPKLVAITIQFRKHILI